MLLLVLSGAFGCAQNAATGIRTKGATSSAVSNAIEARFVARTSTVSLSPEQVAQREAEQASDSWRSFFGCDVTHGGLYTVVRAEGSCSYDLRMADGTEIPDEDDIGGMSRSTVRSKDYGDFVFDCLNVVDLN